MKKNIFYKKNIFIKKIFFVKKNNFAKIYEKKYFYEKNIFCEKKYFLWKKIFFAKKNIFAKIYEKHSKVKNIKYDKLELQQYMADSKFTSNNIKLLFKLRTRMVQVKANFKNGLD